MSNCIFCKIINKEIPGKIVYEDDTCIAFLDLSQATYGHTLVIPKKHFENILEVDPEPLAHIMQVTQKLAKQIVLDLKGKLEFIGVGISDDQVETENELQEVLLGLGYKEKEIVPVLAKVNTSLPIEGQVKDALKLLLRG